MKWTLRPVSSAAILAGIAVAFMFSALLPPAVSRVYSTSGCHHRLVGECPTAAEDTDYRVDTITSTSPMGEGTLIEHRFMKSARHFVTVLSDRGNIAVRPHPGSDENGWGTTWYPGSFLVESDHGAGGSVGDIVVLESGIRVLTSGVVTDGASDSYGTWSARISFTFDPHRQEMHCSGRISVTLDSPLYAQPADLKLAKIATNYLHDVPLLSGGRGDTGDMRHVRVQREPSELWFDWNPVAQPAHFPNEDSSYLSIEVIGNYNQVDSAAQGYARIEPAFKPAFHLRMRSARKEIRFGAIYDTEKGRDFWKDNVGITPLISRGSPETEFNIDVECSSLGEHRIFLPSAER